MSTRFSKQLDRLPPIDRPALAAEPGAKLGVRRIDSKPTLDDLRDKIAHLVGRGIPKIERPNPAASDDLPFFREDTAFGPLYVKRRLCPPASRIGRAPLYAASLADVNVLSLLSLDPTIAKTNIKRALYVDTETTGLAGGTGTVPFLLGLAWFDEERNAFVSEQLLLRRLGEEAPILEQFRKRVEASELFVTYNGKSFDLPLLKTRMVMNRLAPFASRPHLDLVHLARRVHRSRLKVKTLIALEEEVLGRVRIGDVGGGEVVACYAHYLRTGDEEALVGVVAHNEDDVLAMVALVGLYGEPIGSLSAPDLADAATTMKRAHAIELAETYANHAVLGGGGAIARKARGDIAKARGDKVRALLDYESAASELDCAALRLELAKLYEHHVKCYESALRMVNLGTREGTAAATRRRARLSEKSSRARNARQGR